MAALAWLVLAGLPGIASLVLVLPEVPGVPRLALLLNPFLLLVLMGLAGAWAAPRCGLALRRRQPVPARMRQVAAGLFFGLCAATADHALRRRWQAAAGQPASLIEGWAPALLPPGLLYGATVEEITMRWGLMSLITLGAWRLLHRAGPVPPASAL